MSCRSLLAAHHSDLHRSRQHSSACRIRMSSSSADRIVRISKEMSKVLRHSPPPGAMDAAGWISLPVLLRHLRSRPTEAEVRTVVSVNDKKRFVLDDTSVPPRVRAAQGHSVQLEQPGLQPVTDAAHFPLVVHVTSDEGWQGIQGSGELRRMTRTHIHFATQMHHLRKNSWANIFLQLNLQAAMEAGYQFYLSSNDVLLCEGPLPVEFVKRINSKDLPAEWPRATASSMEKGVNGPQLHLNSKVAEPTPQNAGLEDWEVVEHTDAQATPVMAPKPVTSSERSDAHPESAQVASCPTVSSTVHSCKPASGATGSASSLSVGDWPTLAEAASPSRGGQTPSATPQFGVWGRGAARKLQ